MWVEVQLLESFWREHLLPSLLYYSSADERQSVYQCQGAKGKAASETAHTQGTHAPQNTPVEFWDLRIVFKQR